MSQMSDYLEVNLRKHLFRTGSFTKPTELWVSLHTANPTDAASGAEVSGGAYARVQLDPGDANWSAPDATGGATKNLAAILFPAPSGANWGVITHFGVWDSDAGGSNNLICYGTVTPNKTVNDGDEAPLFDVNALTVTFA